MAIHGGASSWLAAAVCSFLLVELLALQGAAAPPLVPAMFVFGDSLVDVGNNKFIAQCAFECKASYPHYGVDYLDSAPTGRFSNGYNLADHLAKHLGFDESPPPFLSLTNPSDRMSTGINFASGGSGLLPQTGNSVLCAQVMTIAEQVGKFTALARQWASADNRSADILSRSLFFISAGSNDLFEYVADLGPPVNETELLQILVGNYTAYLRDLYGVGARKFGVVSTTLVGCCPSQRAAAQMHNLTIDEHKCFAEPNILSAQLYPLFTTMLEDLSRELPGMNYSIADSISMAKFVLEKPSMPPFYNFTVLDTACCGSRDGPFRGDGCNFTALMCPDRSNHLFWDDYHPTEAAAQIAAQMIFSDSSGNFVHPFSVQKLVGGGANATLA